MLSSIPALRSAVSAVGCPILFVGFVATMAESDFLRHVDGFDSMSSRRVPVDLSACGVVVRSPKFRRDFSVHDMVSDPGRATAPRIAVPHVLPSIDVTISAPAMLQISWLIFHTLHSRCVRFAVVVTFHAATLTTETVLPVSQTGISTDKITPACLAHHGHELTAPRRFHGFDGFG